MRPWSVAFFTVVENCATASPAASRSAVSCCTPTKLMSSPSSRRHRQQRSDKRLGCRRQPWCVSFDTLRSNGRGLRSYQTTPRPSRGSPCSRGTRQCPWEQPAPARQGHPSPEAAAPEPCSTTSTTLRQALHEGADTSLAPDPVPIRTKSNAPPRRSMSPDRLSVRVAACLAAAPCSDTAAVQSRMPASPCSYRTFAARIASNPKIVASAAFHWAGVRQPSTPATARRPQRARRSCPESRTRRSKGLHLRSSLTRRCGSR